MHAADFRRYGWFALAAVALACWGAPAQATPVKLPDGRQIQEVDFERHVQGLLGRSGCSSGSCHGSFQGKGGLYLSLFGYSAEKDFLAFSREGLGRRINAVNPDQSLMLLKASGQISHGGGQRFAKGSWQYNIIKEWITAGAPWKQGSGAVAGMEVTPNEHQFTKTGETQKVKVMVTFADGSKEDMSYFCDYRITDDYVGEVTPDGVVSGVRPGDTAVVVSYRGNIRTMRALIPVALEKGVAYPKVPEVNYIDREVFDKLRKLSIVPSNLSSDSEFLRRVYIDTIGCLPTPDEARQFIADKDPNKRTKKIDELLAHPMHAALWATKISDITGNNTDTLEQPRDKRSKMWHDWLRKRFADNTPYDEIVHGILCATSRDGEPAEDWVTVQVGLDQAATKGWDSDYANRKSLDLYWRKQNVMLEQLGEQTAQAFLGVRIECAQCHKHPFDRWTQSDYRSYANIFGQVKFGVSPDSKAAIDKAVAEIRKNQTGKNNRNVQIREVYADNNNLRRLNHPDTNGSLAPKTLGGPEVELKNGDGREALFQWMRSPDNPYFARSFVNRVWANYTGVGIVEPVDSFSVANPPSNDKLLDALAKDFIEHKFDIRHLERTILLSRTYQLSATPNSSNLHDRNNYSRGYLRRMMAEVVVDVLNSAMDTSEQYGNTEAPSGSRAIEVPVSRVQNQNLAYVFRIFGRPTRATNCECERAMEPALPQTLYLMTDTNVMSKITGGRLSKLLKAKATDDEIVEEMFLATLTRYPTDQEKQWAIEHVKAKSNHDAGLVDVVWALINTREFILNH